MNAAAFGWLQRTTFKLPIVGNAWSYRVPLKKPDKKAYNKTWREANKELKLAIDRAWYIENRERKLVSSKQWKQDNKDHVALSKIIWREENRDKYNAIEAKRRAARLNATPKWLTKEQLKEIAYFYLLAQELAWLNEDGKPFDVDHIVPLQGSNFCGLHVPWNLQLLPAKLNKSKGNR